MAASYSFAPDNSRMRAACMVPWASGLLLPLWPKGGASIWTFTGGVLSSGAIATGSNCGYGSAAADATSGAWLTQYAGSLVRYTSGRVSTAFALPSGKAFVGTAFNLNFSQPYVVAADGSIYGGSGVTSVGSFGSGSWSLATSGTTLFSLTSGKLGRFALGSAFAGSGSSTSIAPLIMGTCLAARTSGVAVGGWTNATLPSGYTAMGINPASPIAVAVNPVRNTVDLYLGVAEAWSLAQSATGITAPAYAAWTPDGTRVLVADTLNGVVANFTYTLGTLRLTQSIAVSGAAVIAITPDGNYALVGQATNQVTPLALVGSGWVPGTVFALGNPKAALALSATSVAFGSASGLTYAALTAGLWGVGSSVALPFVPSALATGSGAVFAVGTSGASGYFSAVSGAAVLFSNNWIGSASGVVYEQGQVVVNDQTTPQLRSFGNLNGVYQLIFTKTPSQPWSNVYVSPHTQYSVGGTLFGLGSGSISLNNFTTPFDVEPTRSGAVFALTSGGSASTTLGAGHVPTAITFDASGNVVAATLQNDLYTVAASGGVISKQQIIQFTGQSQAAPLGISSLVFLGSGLYAASSLAGPLVKVL